ncbi:efflux RND transporter periplasmic adaptor subunit [Microbulbifer rhizosphaerae]|uniref:Membrane fusion protein (Multidrug efflux system) n=1 Tax=Microbulbifer rhizosphaerae TaxID=1562603 RepID=A0A7W4WC06_9GAMM|nr:efflux RND transporter periplasmic adaptor subunit [Microbulbifer rhizosphaerae]MBB3061299.1 membrane fusion protein (multidrug efflux system) [Microbulbifer rhizosphaerae]
MLKKKAFVSSVLLASVLLAACGEESAAPPPMAPQVTVVTLKSEPVTLTRELPGRTNPYKVAEVRPQVNGIVGQQLFREGGLVEAGQPLYQLDDAIYRADVDSAKASLQSARATLNEARLNAERIAKLVKSGAVSKQENDSAQATLQKAEAEVARAKAAVQQARIQLDYARISAPIGGRIGKSAVTQGALVTANQSAALATVQQLDPIYVDLTQSASELLSLRKALDAGTLENSGDLPVSILLEDGSTYEHKGKLEFAEASVDPSTGSVLLRVVVPNPEHLLLPGMYVRAVVGRGVRENAILVPQQGIARDPKGSTSAMVVTGEGTVAQRSVQVSRTIGDKWLVESGLEAGDRVIVEGLQKVRPGVPVQAAEAQPAATPAGVEATAGEDQPEEVPAPTAQES